MMKSMKVMEIHSLIELEKESHKMRGLELIDKLKVPGLIHMMMVLELIHMMKGLELIHKMRGLEQIHRMRELIHRMEQK